MYWLLRSPKNFRLKRRKKTAIGKSAIFIYDGYPGGVGLAQHGFEVVQDLFEQTLSHLKTCECEEGCPSCIHSPKCGSGNKPLDKKAAMVILEVLLGHIPFSQINESETDEEQPFVLHEEEEVKLRPKEPRILFLDLETQKAAQEVGGWRNTHLMRVSVVVLYDTLEKKFLCFREDEISALLDHLEKADLVVGFNIKRFDYAVLAAYTAKKLLSLATFDILEDVHRRIGFRLSLDHLGFETLNRRKSGDGLQALEWFKQGEMEKLTDYCRMDVELTRDLFLYGLDNGHLIYRTKQDDQRVMLRVDWNLENLLKKN